MMYDPKVKNIYEQLKSFSDDDGRMMAQLHPPPFTTKEFNELPEARPGMKPPFSQEEFNELPVKQNGSDYPPPFTKEEVDALPVHKPGMEPPFKQEEFDTLPEGKGFIHDGLMPKVKGLMDEILPQAQAEEAQDPDIPGDFYDRLSGGESGGKSIPTRKDKKTGKHESSAFGKYQFVERTWGDMMKRDKRLTWDGWKHKDPAQQEIAVRMYTNDNAKALRKAGIPITYETLYFGHHFGTQSVRDYGRAIFLESDPFKPIPRGFLTPGVLRANEALIPMKSIVVFRNYLQKIIKGSSKSTLPLKNKKVTYPMSNTSRSGGPFQEELNPNPELVEPQEDIYSKQQEALDKIGYKRER